MNVRVLRNLNAPCVSLVYRGVANAGRSVLVAADSAAGVLASWLLLVDVVLGWSALSIAYCLLLTTALAKSWDQPQIPGTSAPSRASSRA